MSTPARQPDRVFLVLLGVILAFGLVMLTSASGPLAWNRFQDPYWYVKHQLLVGLLPGLLLFFVCSKLDYRFWRRRPGLLFAAMVVLLLAVFVPGLAADWGTSKSWLNLGGYSLQPAELVKLLFIFFLAALLERRAARPAGATNELLALAAAFAVIAGLIMLQPDLGNLLVLAAIAFVVYFLSGAPWSHIGLIAALGAVGLAIVIKTARYRFDRFMIFLNPGQDPQGIGYHINQAFLAIGSGGLFGLGLGHSRQKYLYLPEIAGDSIFAVIAEELGFVLTLAVLGLFLALIWRGVRIAAAAPDAFGRLVALGITVWIFCQTVFNIGSMVGLMPLTGLTLPFVSYGGTSLVVLLAASGVMVNISKHASRS